MESSLKNEVSLKRSTTKSKTPSLKEMIREDELLQDFFRFIKENHLRNEAHELLEKRLGG